MTANDNQLVISFDEVEDKKADFEAPVKAIVSFGGAQADKFGFINPIPAEDLKELRWYIERSWQYRAKEEEGRIEKIETGLEQIGKALFNAVFEKSARGMGMYERLMERRKDGVDCSIVIDTKEPRILRLPWELLADEGGYLFSRNPSVNIRRRMQKTRETDARDFSLPVRVLMVVSRPSQAGFIDPRSSAEPLLDALDGLGQEVEVEFLRPPTVAALMRRIRDRKKPPIHVVHFDGHGVYDAGIGLGFLLFEKDDYSNDLADSSRLGSLLNECGIPLMILDACQSAEPDDRNPFGSVAAKLIESGVGGVVAMNYSVLVETSRRLIGHFYQALAQGESVSAALGLARLELLADTSRHHYFNQREQKEIEIELQDWFVPALYQQADELTPFKPDGRALAAVQKACLPQQAKGERGGFPPAPLHGFKGRARELLDLERAFAGRNIVVLHGFGGQGKTSLAAQAAEWFTRTHLFERAAFVTFETGASLDFVLNELGTALVRDDFANEQTDKKVAAIAKALQEKTALVVFDNFESALPGGNAPMTELQELLNAAAQWFPAGLDTPREKHAGLLDQRGSRLLITTRNPNIPHSAFTPSQDCLHKELEGLAQSDALELAASILEAHSLPRPPRVPLENLLAFLKGHPLSLQLALPQLRTYSAGQLVEQYQAILPQMQTGAARERNESLDRLGEEAKTLLTRLAVFESGAWEPVLLAVTEIPEETWGALKPQLTSTALIREENLPGIDGQPFIHFHPTLAPYLRALPESQPDHETRTTQYWQVYYSLARQLYRDDTQHPLIARALASRELPNLKRALHLALEAGALDEAVTFADRLNRFLDAFGRWRERDEVAAEVEKYTSKQVDKDGKLTKAQYLQESGRGQRLLQQGRAGQAEQVFRALLQRLEGAAAYDTRYDQTLVLGYLGRCLEAQGRPASAADCYRRALGLAEGLEQTDGNKLQASKFHTDLADVLADSGQYADARKEYETSLAIKKQVGGDERGEGVVLGQLGTLALTQGDLNDARKRYIESIDLFRRIGEAQHEAIYLHQLGMVAQEQREWDEAERCYKQSLTIKESLGDWALAATSCNQLALVAENAGRLQEAERWYLRTLEHAELLPDQGAKVYGNLANLCLSQNRLEEAETSARRALAIVETLELSSEPWKTYSLLAEIAAKRGQTNEARSWRRQEQESFAAFAGNDTQIKQFEPLIAAIVQAANGDEKAKAYLEDQYPKMQGAEEWRTGAQAFKRLVAGERDFESLTDGLARTQALIIHRALEALNGETAPSPRPAPESGRAGEAEQQGGMTLPQLLELVERAANGDRELGGQLFGAFQQMTRVDDPVMSTLGKTLLVVLVGERQPDLSGLPDELASAVRGLLGRLKH